MNRAPRSSPPTPLRLLSIAVAIAAATLMLTSCASYLSGLRRHTYPPDFRYITQEQLESTMWQLAAQAERLDQITRDPDRLDPHRDEIRVILEQMERTTNQLKTDRTPANHPMISANLDRFRADIRSARRGVDHEPPNYLRAAAIPSACVYCHTN
jgi:hypothetical protein